MLAELVAGGALAVAAGTGPGALAKKKMKNCQFAKSNTTWKLKKSCTAKKELVIPDNVSLDGNGKTITLSGPLANFAGIGVSVGSAFNLSIDGSKLSGSCLPEEFAGLHSTGGSLQNVGVIHLPCGTGIVGKAAPLTISDSGCQFITGLGIAIHHVASITHTMVSACDSGILASGPEAVAAVDSCSVFGNGPSGGLPAQTDGITFTDGAGGSVSGTEITGFNSTPASGFTSCGILFMPTAASTILLANLNFPDPHCDANICDQRVG